MLSPGGYYIVTDIREMMEEDDGMDFFYMLAKATSFSGLSVHTVANIDWYLTTTSSSYDAYVESVTFKRNAVLIKKRPVEVRS